MPLKGVRYRVKTYKSGKRVRLAFRGNKVVETKTLPRKGRGKRSKSRRGRRRR